MAECWFSKDGVCKNGETCHYKHTGENPPQVTLSALMTQVIANLPHGPLSGDDLKEAKALYNVLGMVLKRSDTIPSNDKKSSIISTNTSSKKSSKKACRNWKNGNCRFGVRCHFWHEPESHSLPYEIGRTHVDIDGQRYVVTDSFVDSTKDDPLFISKSKSGIPESLL